MTIKDDQPSATTQWPEQKHLQNYLELMFEIKKRSIICGEVFNRPARVMFKASVIDFCYLQFRKILELIAFSTLSANIHQLEALQHGQIKEYNANKVLKAIEKKFGNVYPRPLDKDTWNEQKGMIQHNEKKHGYLTR